MTCPLSQIVQRELIAYVNIDGPSLLCCSVVYRVSMVRYPFQYPMASMINEKIPYICCSCGNVVVSISLS